jgi:hypothetical protein
MPTIKPSFTVASHFSKSAPSVRATYDAVLRAARALGPVEQEAKKTSIHLVRKTAFAGVATRQDALILTLKASGPLASPRVERSEQTSANRWHHEIRLRTPTDVNRDVRRWLAAAYELSG